VKEIYGELLVPIIANGPKFASHFNLELGGRVSDWNLSRCPISSPGRRCSTGGSETASVSARFQPGVPRAELGRALLKRTQIFGGGGSRDWCGDRLTNPGGFSATPTAGVDPAQTAQTKAMCTAMMGAGGAASSMTRPQQRARRTGIANSFGNPNLREEQADTWTMASRCRCSTTGELTVDWWKIQIEQMIASKAPTRRTRSVWTAVQSDRRSRQRGLPAHRPESGYRRVAVSSIECSTMRVPRTSKVSTSR
jgi:hypothetical protein